MKDIITKFGIPEVQPVDESNNNDLQGNVIAMLNAVIVSSASFVWSLSSSVASLT